jgi:hypothetical protein
MCGAWKKPPGPPRTPGQAAAAWRVKAAQWAEKAEGATLAAIAADRQWTTDKIAVEQAQLALLTRKLGAVAGQVSFSAEDLEQVRRIEQTRRAHLEKESVQATAAVQQRTREFEAATLALQQAARGAAGRLRRRQLDVAEARQRAARTALDTSRRDIEILANLESLTTAAVGCGNCASMPSMPPTQIAPRGHGRTAQRPRRHAGLEDLRQRASRGGSVRTGRTGHPAGASRPVARSPPVRSRHDRLTEPARLAHAATGRRDRPHRPRSAPLGR